MKLWFSLFLACSLVASAPGQQLQPASVTVTKGTLSFDEKAITFRSKDNEQRYPFPEPKISARNVEFKIPGLRIQRFEPRVAQTPQGDKDVSRLVLECDDATSIELVFGQPVAVFRIEITFADHQRITIWHPASKLK